MCRWPGLAASGYSPGNQANMGSVNSKELVCGHHHQSEENEAVGISLMKKENWRQLVPGPEVSLQPWPDSMARQGTLENETLSPPLACKHNWAPDHSFMLNRLEVDLTCDSPERWRGTPLSWSVPAWVWIPCSSHVPLTWSVPRTPLGAEEAPCVVTLDIGSIER